eukprot:COSAG01_NODE_10100_length_2251_cov_2.899164_1_plen_136_part_00
MPAVLLQQAVYPAPVPAPRSEMGRGLFAKQVIPAGSILLTGVQCEVGIKRAEWKRGLAIVKASRVFKRATVAVGWRLNGTLVYLTNCADPSDYMGVARQTANARFSRRRDELVVRVTCQLEIGEQLLVECYLEDE